MKKRHLFMSVLALFVMASLFVGCSSTSKVVGNYPKTTVAIEYDSSVDYASKLEFASGDIEVAKTWKIRPLPATYVVPSKGEFFSSGSSSNSDGDSGNK